MAYQRHESTPEDLALEQEVYGELQKAKVTLYMLRVKVFEEEKNETTGKRKCGISLSYPIGDREYRRISFALWDEQIDLHRPYLMQYVDGKMMVVGIPANGITANGRYLNARDIAFFFGLTATLNLIEEDPYAHPITKDPALTPEQQAEIDSSPF